MLWADLFAFAAFYAFTLVNDRLAVFEGDRLLRAYDLARMRQAPLAGVSHMHHIVGALMARELDDVDKRRLIVLLRDDTILRTVRNRRVFICLADRQTHGKTHPLIDDRPLEEDTVSVSRLLTRNDAVRNVLHLLEEIRIAAVIFIRQLCYL